jgi:hypothetical protein
MARTVPTHPVLTPTLALALAAGGAVSLTAPAFAGADLPVERVTLYRSGVGYFEHAGTVAGDAVVGVRFETERINDVLKSMVVFDLGGGRVGGVNYQHKQTLGQRMDRFSFRLEGTTIDLLKQLRGERIRLRTPQGEVEGSILGAEERMTTLGGGDHPSITRDWFVTLLTSSGVRAVPQLEILSFELLDPDLADELQRALETVATHRTDNLSEVEIDFRGDGERRVAVAYTLEAPIWKTSYRLVLPDATGGEPTIHAWAIVENATDSDWEGVELSLAAGRPVSFTMDLQTPYHLQRPDVRPPVLANVGPTVYDDARLRELEESMDEPARNEFRQQMSKTSGRAAMEMMADAVGARAPSSSAGGVPQEAFATMLAGAAASAGDVGEQFFFTLDEPVSIERGQSAMLPILSAPIEGRRVTIWTPNGQTPHPMKGVELENDTNMHLMAGPLAIYDGGRYAGDAMIESTARNQDRLLSFAVDQDLQTAREVKHASEVQSIRIINGSLLRQMRQSQTTEYTLSNHDGSRPRTVLIEHERTPGWEIAGDLRPISETDTHYRFEVAVEPGETVDFAVEIERIDRTTMGVTSIPVETLLVYSKNGKVSPEVIAAVQRAMDLQGGVNAIEQRIGELEQERQEIFNDQNRIRQNMNSVGRNSDLWARYSQKLSEQESRLEKIIESIDGAQRELAGARRALAEYLRTLTVN